MPNIINPHAAVLIKGASDWFSDDEPIRLDIDIEVNKDLDPEPNEATVILYNLNVDTRSRVIDPAVRDTPIEIWFAPIGSDTTEKCFVGEIQQAVSTPMRPGYETRLSCTSQRWHTRGKYVEKKTYEAGTPISDIVNELTAIIDLTVQSESLPTGGLLLSQSFSGPAFFELRKFLWSYGLFTYIADGVLYISSVYAPPNPVTVEIPLAIMTTLPQARERTDAVDVILHTVTDTNGLNPFAKRNRRNKRTWAKQALSRNDYVESEVIDDIIFGIECETLGLPSLQPDNIVRFENDPNQYRVQSVTHSGNTRDGFSTLIQADLFEGDTLFNDYFGLDAKTPQELRELYGIS